MDDKYRRSQARRRAIAQGLARTFGRAVAVMAALVAILMWVVGSHAW